MILKGAAPMLFLTRIDHGYLIDPLGDPIFVLDIIIIIIIIIIIHFITHLLEKNIQMCCIIK